MQRTAVSAEIARSWLLVAATRPDDFSTAQGSRADQIILDVEDAVDPGLKDKARTDVVAWLAGGGTGWVRINDRSASRWLPLGATSTSSSASPAFAG